MGSMFTVATVDSDDTPSMACLKASAPMSFSERDGLEKSMDCGLIEFLQILLLSFSDERLTLSSISRLFRLLNTLESVVPRSRKI